MYIQHVNSRLAAYFISIQFYICAFHFIFNNITFERFSHMSYKLIVVMTIQLIGRS